MSAIFSWIFNRFERVGLAVAGLVAGILVVAAAMASGVSAQAQSPGWSPVSHVPSRVATRWTTVVTDPTFALHAFWVAAEPDTGSVYTSQYQTIMHATSADGTEWTSPIDVLFDAQNIDAFSVLTTRSGYHLFWNSDCIHHASVQFDAEIDNPWAWIRSARCVAPSSVAEAVAVATDHQNTIYLLYSPGGALYIQASVDDGIHWSPATLIATASQSSGADLITYPRIARSDDDQLYVAWTGTASAQRNYENIGIFFARSSDRGESWTLPLQLGDETAIQPNVVAPGAGTVHVVWNTRVGTSKRIHSWSTNRGETWSTETELLSREMAGTSMGVQGPPGLEADTEGNLFALLGTNAGPRYVEWVDGQWTGFEVLGNEDEGETWVTGITLVTDERICAYWSAQRAPTLGFSITCKGNMPAREITVTPAPGEPGTPEGGQQTAQPAITPQEAPMTSPDSMSTAAPLPATVAIDVNPAKPARSHSFLEVFLLGGGVSLAILLVAIATQMARRSG